MKRLEKLTTIALIATSLSVSLTGQNVVDINLNVKHFVDTTSVFDRSKYIIFHDDVGGSEWESDELKKTFLEDYDVYFGRNNGSIVWEYNNTREDANKPGWPDTNYMKTRGANSIDDYVEETFLHQFEDRYHNMMVGGQEHMFPHGQSTTQGGLVYDEEDFAATAEFYGHYFKHFFGEGGETGKPRPRLVEVCNEPFVKVNQLGTTTSEMSEYHNVVARRIKELNPDIMVGGYSAAHPAYAANNFGHWENNWKTFIDVAGENMDFFSFHLYDFIQNTSDMSLEAYRKGSNIEAIMDMINHYSMLKLGETKPWSVSEYGWLCKECEGGYDPKEDWYNLRAFNSMLLQLMERPDQVIHSIPFMLLKANWAHPVGEEYNTYGPRLMREIGELPGEPAHGGWIYTYLLQYYQLWANLNGTRIDTKSTDQDILTDAYIDGKKLYLIINNLDKGDVDVDLNFIDSTNNTVEDIFVKRSYGIDDMPILDTVNYTESISQITLPSEGTLLLEYTFTNDIEANETNIENTYWATSYLQSITGSNQTFLIGGIELADQGEAVLRLGIGREHGLSTKPLVLVVNGTTVEIPNDFRGFDQSTRDRFFGVLEIPVPYGLLQENNTIGLKFEDNGGYISSLALQVFNFSRPFDRSEGPSPIKQVNNTSNLVNVFPNPVKDNFVVSNPKHLQLNYRILNVQGQTIRKGYVDETRQTIVIDEMPSGIYFMHFDTHDTQQVIRLIKQ